ncbi:MAG: ATP-binding protein [Halothiobacillus sp.]
MTRLTVNRLDHPRGNQPATPFRWLTNALPKSLFGQILLALILGILAAFTVSLSLLLADRARLGERLLGDYAVQRIAQIIQIQNEATPVERRQLARWLSSPPTRLLSRQAWRKTEKHPNAAQINGATNLFAERLRKALLTPIPIQVFAIQWEDYPRRPFELDTLASERLELPAPLWERTHPWQIKPLPPPHEERFLLIQAQLDDGSILTLRHALPPPIQWPFRTMGWLLLLGLLVIIGIGWVVRRLTRPLDALAQAATHLPKHLDQPPLAETGPTEVARAARAFNHMQNDIKRMIEARGQALAGVSHDLRLPITRLRLRIAHLPDDPLKQKIEADLTEMDDMIGHTLAFLRAGTPSEPVVAFDLNALLDILCEDMTLLGARIERHGHAQHPIKTRPQALQRALQNVLDNARRYGDGRIDLRLTETGNQLILSIEDRGPGIGEADRERIFEPYVRLEASRARHTGGSGLGLAIARAIVRGMSGDIRVLSREGGGTQVQITLPKMTP